jgi:hypothetical protein
VGWQVYHYGYYEVAEGEEATSAFQKGEDVTMVIDGERRSFNSRLVQMYYVKVNILKRILITLQ